MYTAEINVKKKTQNLRREGKNEIKNQGQKRKKEKNEKTKRRKEKNEINNKNKTF